MNQQELPPREDRPEAERRPITAIVADLWSHSEALLQQHVRLALMELEERLDKGKLALRRAAIAGGLMHAAYLGALAALMLVLSEFFRPSLAAFAVAVVANLGAYLYAEKATAELRQPSQSDSSFRSGAAETPHQELHHGSAQR